MEITIYTAPYQKEIDEKTCFDLRKPGLFVSGRYIHIDASGKQYDVDKILLIASDKPPGFKKKESFWPFMCDLEREEAIELRDALDSILNSKDEYPTAIQIGNKI